MRAMTGEAKKSRGRPKKPKSVKGPRGAPRKPLSQAPDRYCLALMQANIDEGANFRFSERGIEEAYAALLYGVPFSRRFPAWTRRNMEALAKGRPFRMWFRKEKFKPLGNPPTENYPSRANKAYRDRNDFRPYAEKLRARVSKVRKSPVDSPDRRWLAAMSKAWLICLRGDMRLRDHAEALAAIVGEREYFCAVMLPALYESFAGSRNWLRIFGYLNTHPPKKNV